MDKLQQHKFPAVCLLVLGILCCVQLGLVSYTKGKFVSSSFNLFHSLIISKDKYKFMSTSPENIFFLQTGRMNDVLATAN